MSDELSSTQIVMYLEGREKWEDVVHPQLSMCDGLQWDVVEDDSEQAGGNSEGRLCPCCQRTYYPKRFQSFFLADSDASRMGDLELCVSCGGLEDKRSLYVAVGNLYMDLHHYLCCGVSKSKTYGAEKESHLTFLSRQLRQADATLSVLGRGDCEDIFARLPLIATGWETRRT